MLKVATTENAARPFCLIDTATGLYVRKPDSNRLLTFKSREAAEKQARKRNSEDA